MNARRGSARGFTLIELLVVVGIMIVITTIVLLNNNKFSGQVTLENLAYDIALTVRQTQVYGIAVNRFGNCTTTTEATCFGSTGYGMHFSTANPQQYLMFADLPNTPTPGVFDASYPVSSVYPDGELIDQYSLNQGYSIYDLCGEAVGASGDTCGLTSLDILFERPEPDAYISANSISAIANPNAIQTQAEIVLRSPQGATSTIVVYASGQITVQ